MEMSNGLNCYSVNIWNNISTVRFKSPKEKKTKPKQNRWLPWVQDKKYHPYFLLRSLSRNSQQGLHWQSCSPGCHKITKLKLILSVCLPCTIKTIMGFTVSSPSQQAHMVWSKYLESTQNTGRFFVVKNIGEKLHQFTCHLT